MIQVTAVSDELSLRGIIHDLSNALTVILGWAEEAKDQDPEARARALSIIEERARSAHLLARRAIGVDVGRDVATISALCSNLSEALQVTAERRQALLSVDIRDCAHDQVEAAADFEQVLQNLLLNAFEYAPQGSTVQVTLEANATHFFVRVVDQGAGVPEEQRSELFAGHTTREGGTGLGLQHSRRMAESHGGSLELVSSPRGAAFMLRWARSQRASAAALTTAHVVLVEDDDAIADLVSLGLEARGATVERAGTLAELESKLHPGVNAVVLDWSPLVADPDAWAAALKLRAPAARVIVVTGQPERVTLRGVRLLVKPFEVKELLAALVDEPRRASGDLA